MNNQYYQRFKDILSDPINKLIKRGKDAGKIEDGIVTMYNGLKVYENCYYDEFSDIFWINEGVHEPQEEYLFHSVIQKIKSDTPTMLELGSYWGFYSMSLINEKPKSKCYCIEAGVRELEIGKANFKLNGMTADFTLGKVDFDGIQVDQFLAEKKIDHLDILHSDIQGHELEMLIGATNSLKSRSIDYIFISTHSQTIHNSCLNFLKGANYNIVTSVDMVETFSCDGLIFAQNPDLPFQEVQFPKKTETESISDADMYEKIKNNLNYLKK